MRQPTRSSLLWQLQEADRDWNITLQSVGAAETAHLISYQRLKRAECPWATQAKRDVPLCGLPKTIAEQGMAWQFIRTPGGIKCPQIR